MSVVFPQIGQRVWYRANTATDQVISAELLPLPEIYDPAYLHTCSTGPAGQPFDAVIVYVHTDRIVNLLVTDHIAQTRMRRDVTLVQSGDAVPTDRSYCEWIPVSL